MISEYLWAKYKDEGQWHPLILHLIDVAAVADILLSREPETTRNKFADLIGLPWTEARPWILLLIACHDLGKASPGFQLKWKESKKLLISGGINIPRLPNTSINHAFVSQLALEKLLKNVGWPEELSMLCADAMGCHHGTRATASVLNHLEGNRNGADERNWFSVWEEIFNALCRVFNTGNPPQKLTLLGEEFILLAGLTSFSDWIGSNEDFFSYGNILDCKNLDQWFSTRRQSAEKALNSIGWFTRNPLIKELVSFESVFPDCNPPRPLQKAVIQAVSRVNEPCVILLEAPMGEGKTEAAFYAHLELQRRFGHRGMYIALPTKATGNAMFTRTLRFLHYFSAQRTLDLQLVHGAAQLNEKFMNLRFQGIEDEEKGGSLRAAEWFTHKKRALLSEYGVGTIDQALLPILPVRHYFVRLWGLANRVVVFDEIHAYDAYTGTLLLHLIRWLRALGSSVVLLSATLPPEFRRRLARVLEVELPVEEKAYPRLTVFSKTSCLQEHFDADAVRRKEIQIFGIDSSVETIMSTIDHDLFGNGFAGIIVNTVQRAQNLYKIFPDGELILQQTTVVGKRLIDGTEIYLFHARYSAQDRQYREDAVLGVFGKEGNRSGRRILIATQVAEQSLDLDFDMMITDLAPIDLILQRAGRLWRHEREERPIKQAMLFICGLEGEKPGSFGKPLWWNKVYQREDILLRTWECLKRKNKLNLPDEIDNLVREVYEGAHYPDDAEIMKRLEKAEVDSDGQRMAQQGMAHQSIIGFPDDGSWKDTSRFYLYDDDEPGMHSTLKAQTRLGEDAVSVIPLFSTDGFDASLEPDSATVRKFILLMLSLSRKGVIQQLRCNGIPKGWEKVPLLRNCYPMSFDADGVWLEDKTVRLDKELGLVYKSGEA